MPDGKVAWCIYVPLDKFETVKEVWEKEYYQKLFPEISDERLKESVVVSKPGSRSYIFKVSGRDML